MADHLYKEVKPYGGILTNMPVRDPDKCILVKEKRTGLPMALDRIQDFDPALHERIPVAEAPAEEQKFVPQDESHQEEQTEDTLAEWEALKAKAKEVSYLKLSGAEKRRWKVLKELYAQ